MLAKRFMLPENHKGHFGLQSSEKSRTVPKNPISHTSTNIE